MITTELIGGLGNNMFQFAIGKIIADIKGYNLQCDAIAQLNKYFSNINNVSDRTSVYESPMQLGYGSTSRCIQHIDINDVIDHKGSVQLKGFFQKYYLYENRLDMLRDLFDYDDGNFEKPLYNDLVVHIRWGDYVALNHYMLPETYIDIINSIDYDRCILVTDDPHNPMMAKFGVLKNYKIFHGGVLEDFTFMKCARNLIISQSTFSWWAAFLGHQERVYVPLYLDVKGYPWKLNPCGDDIDLIPACDKFIKVQI